MDHVPICLTNDQSAAHLRLHGPVPQLLGEQQRHLVVLGRLLELPEEDVRVAEVAVRAPLRAPVAELLGDLEALLVVVDRLAEVPQEVVNITEVATRSALGCAVLGK